ncbi:CBS domain-containing protein [Acidovorax sp. 107]|uniref:CBS domain-containing protein n=1 Tax=Acidovorax sp. 107 TaxID=2135638 RepID=UPI000D3D0BA9|nr:CBS domain-containing protein [Acidovorax sp. 107]PUA95630.1 CBS domain-containing protein [Acidovorax sp. 107]
MQTIVDVMTRGIRTVAPSDTVTQAAQAMRELDVGALPVCDGVRLMGMLTDRDIVVRGVAQERVHALVSELMSEGMLYCHEHDAVSAVLESMRSQQVRRIPVVDKEQRLVGMVSLGDLATRGNEDDQTASALRGISEPSQPHRGGLSAASGAAGGGQTD